MSAMKQIAKIGSMDRRITIQAFTSTQDESGGEVLTWQDRWHVSASMSYPPTVGIETFLGLGEQGLQQTATRNQIFTIRHIPTVNEKMRIIYEHKTYDIISIQELGRRRFLKIHAQIKD
jgi:SPP1 family predicted phage head-tail adaptor